MLTIRQANDSVHACLGKIYTIFSNAIFHLVWVRKEVQWQMLYFTLLQIIPFENEFNRDTHLTEIHRQPMKIYDISTKVHFVTWKY